MILNPFEAIGSFILGLIKAGKVQAWTRLFVSVFGTAFVSFFGVMGATIPCLYSQLGPAGSLTLGFAAGCLAMATSVLFLWRRSELTKKLPIVVPGGIEEALRKVLEKESMVITGEGQK